MIKVLLILMISMLGMVNAEHIMVVELANGRAAPASSGKWIQYICPGCSLEVLDEISDYTYVKVTAGTDHVGKKGWVWSARYADGKIIREGVCLRSTPHKDKKDPDANLIAKIPVGCSVQLIKVHRTWVKVKGSCLQAILWVWAGNISTIK